MVKPLQHTVKSAALFACMVLVPSTVYAQASIAGVVRDASGAVLPGVTVEAASPALIEKVRTVVSDGLASTGSWTCVPELTR